mgnify:CR=1 FL=1
MVMVDAPREGPSGSSKTSASAPKSTRRTRKGGLGAELKWRPRADWAIDATLNPDFSQVETDQLQLDFNNSFALFYQEKRPFFLEGADYFTTPFDVLYTRQIADPDFGLRVTGRNGGNAYGAIVARDATTLVLVPGVLGSGFRELDQKANVAVGRYRYDLNEHASIGAIGTFRAGDELLHQLFRARGAEAEDFGRLATPTLRDWLPDPAISSTMPMGSRALSKSSGWACGAGWRPRPSSSSCCRWSPSPASSWARWLAARCWLKPSSAGPASAASCSTPSCNVTTSCCWACSS